MMMLHLHTLPLLVLTVAGIVAGTGPVLSANDWTPVTGSQRHRAPVTILDRLRAASQEPDWADERYDIIDLNEDRIDEDIGNDDLTNFVQHQDEPGYQNDQEPMIVYPAATIPGYETDYDTPIDPLYSNEGPAYPHPLGGRPRLPEQRPRQQRPAPPLRHRRPQRPPSQRQPQPQPPYLPALSRNAEPPQQQQQQQQPGEPPFNQNLPPRPYQGKPNRPPPPPAERPEIQPPFHNEPQQAPPNLPPPGFSGGHPERPPLPPPRRPPPRVRPAPRPRPNKNDGGVVATISSTLGGIVSGARCKAEDLAADIRLQDETFMRSQLDCVLERGPCDELGASVKRMAPEILKGLCPKPYCDECKKKQIQKVMSTIATKYPREWNEMFRQVGRRKKNF